MPDGTGQAMIVEPVDQPRVFELGAERSFDIVSRLP
jgi:hypothetical protein